jgi:hypothetical protein
MVCGQGLHDDDMDIIHSFVHASIADSIAMSHEYLAEDVVWHFAIPHQDEVTIRGRKNVIEQLENWLGQEESSEQFEVQSMHALEGLVVVLGRTEGAGGTEPWAQVFRLLDRRIVESWQMLAAP